MRPAWRDRGRGWSLPPADPDEYARSVFINCPFDAGYVPLFRALVYCLIRLGFVPRCAREVGAAAGRISRIFDLIRACRYGIHDLSLQSPDSETGLPRFNMPFELGLFLGCVEFSADAEQRLKVLMVMDSEPFRLRTSLSDIAAYEVSSHKGSPEAAIRLVRDWLANSSGLTLYGALRVQREYMEFEQQFSEIVREGEYASQASEVTFADLCSITRRWIDRTFPFPV